MTHGRNICNQLKAVRKSIAEENDIDLDIPECTYLGECRGTCPRCEAEVRFLENALADRLRLGKMATVAGLALGLAAPGLAAAQGTIRPAQDRRTTTEKTVIHFKSSEMKGLLGDYPEPLRYLPTAPLPVAPPPHPPVELTLLDDTQKVTIKGLVMDSLTGETLPLVNITIMHGDSLVMNLRSDFDGLFNASLPEGNYALRFQCIGYDDYILLEDSYIKDTFLPTIKMNSQPNNLIGYVEIIEEKNPIIEIDPNGQTQHLEKDDIHVIVR